MIRTRSTYILTYDKNADKYLKSADTYTQNMQEGQYLQNGGVLSILFNYAEYAINTNNTSALIANNVLDKIIVEA